MRPSVFDAASPRCVYCRRLGSMMPIIGWPKALIWASTCEKDHKRLLRALIADITITSQPEGRELRVGIRWRSGASEEHTVQRPKTRQEVIRTPSEAIKLTRRLAPDHPNTQIAEQLNAAGLRTGTGGPFAAGHVQWIRWRHKIPYPATLANDGERTVSQIANELGVSDATIYDWITTGKLTARRGPANRLYIPYGPDVQQECRDLVANSFHVPAETKIRAAGGAV